MAIGHKTINKIGSVEIKYAWQNKVTTPKVQKPLPMFFSIIKHELDMRESQESQTNRPRFPEIHCGQKTNKTWSMFHVSLGQWLIGN